MISRLVKKILSLRYSISIEGLENINAQQSVLVLPNHPAEIDPVIITTYLWDLLRPRPVVLETMYKLPVIKSVMQRIRAIPMADMDFESGPYKRRRIMRTLEHIATALNQGDNILLYPSGRLSVTGEEKLGGASGVQSILNLAPQTNVAVVRIHGLYGSIFSKAPSGGITPDVFKTFRKASTILLQNLLFFSPRRAVSIEITFNPPEFPRYGDTLAINKYLEDIYNSPTPEKPTAVSYSFIRHTIPEFLPPTLCDNSVEDIDEHIFKKVYAYIAHIANTSTEELSPQTLLGEELGIDSLSMAELLVWLDREFEIHDVALHELTSIASVLRIAAGQNIGAKPRPQYTPPVSWGQLSDSRSPPELEGAKTIEEAFLIVCARHGNRIAMGDEKSGICTWEQLKAKVIFLARYIASTPDQHIGILLPASVAGTVTSIATILAGKIPVFLNWTAGKQALLHACEATQLKTILTSESFLDIVTSDLHFLESRFVMLEEVRDNASWREKLKSHRLSKESLSQILKAFGGDQRKSSDTAAILFTSGSEALPKGVPLSHNNILSNIRGILDAVQISENDILLGFLPPFHSFGLTVCCLLPLVTGLRVVYHPNPNESRKLGRAIESWGCSVIAGTPTFLRAILKSGPVEQFRSLRAIVTGAERAPNELFELAESIDPNLQVLEGYGITECGPVVSVARPNESRIGVGRPLDDTSIAVVHPETLTPCEEGTQGLILIKGPSVFSGYLDHSIEPFLEHDNSQWYNSGDLGFLKDGHLVITGRLKRFVKIAGEMISLGAIEDALQKHLYSPDGSPTVAVLSQGVEGDSRPKLLAVIAGNMSLESAQEILKSSGFPTLVHLSSVHHLRTLPLLGSGKIDYQSLKQDYT
jgi:acyl-CoA synthetase (AMP-forming)/AMP-acid ligase II/1-acyl-sn-glycerol-3-phosphate acyltransferase/acyl carrier protein